MDSPEKLRRTATESLYSADNPFIATDVRQQKALRDNAEALGTGRVSDLSWLDKTSASVVQRQRGMPDLLAAAGNFVTGDRAGAKRRLGAYMENEELATSLGPAVQDIGQVKNAGDAASFVGYTVANMLPDAAAALLGAGVVSGITKQVLKRTAEKQIAGRLLSKEGAKLAAERTALKTAQVSSTPAFQAADAAGKNAFLKGAGMQASEEVGKELGVRAAAIAARKGTNGLVTGSAAVTGSAIGGTPSQLKEQADFMQKNADTLTASDMGKLIGGAAVAASTDYLPFARLSGRFGDDIINAAVKRNRFMKRFTKETAEQFAAEGSQEAGQAFIIKASQSFVDENVELFDHDARMEYLTNFVAGGIVGGALGGAGEVGRTGARKISELFNPERMASIRTASAGAFKAGKAKWQKTVQGEKPVTAAAGAPTDGPENAAAAAEASGRTLNPIAQKLSIMPGSGAAEQVEASQRLDKDALSLMGQADDYFAGKSDSIFKSAHNLDGYYGDPIADTLGGVVFQDIPRRMVVQNSAGQDASTVENPLFQSENTKNAMLSLAKIMRNGQDGAAITDADRLAVGWLRSKLPNPDVIDNLVGLRSTHPSFTAEVEAALEARTSDDTGSGDREATVESLQAPGSVRAGVDSSESMGGNTLMAEGMLGNKGLANLRSENSPVDLIAGEFRADRVHSGKSAPMGPALQSEAKNGAERLRLTVAGIADAAAKDSATPQAKDLARRVSVLYGVATDSQHPDQAKAAQLLSQVIEKNAPAAGPDKLPETPDRKNESVEKLKTAQADLKKSLHASTNFFRKSKSPKSEAEFNARLNDPALRASYVPLKGDENRLFDLGSVIRNYRTRAEMLPGEDPALGALTAVMMDADLRKQLDVDSIRWGEVINFNDGTHVTLPTLAEVNAARLSKRKATTKRNQKYSPAALRVGVELPSGQYIRPTARMSAEEAASDFENENGNDDDTQRFKLEAKDKPGTINQLDGSDPVTKPADENAPRRAVSVSGKNQATVTALRAEFRQGRALQRALQRVADALGVDVADINGITPANNAKATDVIVWVAQDGSKSDKPMQVRKSNLPEILLVAPKGFRNSKNGMFRRGTAEITTSPEKLYAYAREYLVAEAENAGMSERKLALLTKELNHADAKPKLDTLLADMAAGNRDSQGPRVREAAPDSNEAAKAGLRDNDTPPDHKESTQKMLNEAADAERAKQKIRERKAAVNGMDVPETKRLARASLARRKVKGETATATAASKKTSNATQQIERVRAATTALREKSVAANAAVAADPGNAALEESARVAQRNLQRMATRLVRMTATPKGAAVPIGEVSSDKQERFSRLETRVDRALTKLKIDPETMRERLDQAYAQSPSRKLEAGEQRFSVTGNSKVSNALNTWASTLNEKAIAAVMRDKALQGDVLEYAIRLLDKREGASISDLNPARAERVTESVSNPSIAVVATKQPDRGLVLSKRERVERRRALDTAQSLRDKPAARPFVSRIETAAREPAKGVVTRERAAKREAARARLASAKQSSEERAKAERQAAGILPVTTLADIADLPGTPRTSNKPGPVVKLELNDPKLKASVAASWKQKPINKAEHKTNIAGFVKSLTSLVGAKSAQALIKTGVVSFVTRGNLPPFAKQVHPTVQAFEYEGRIYILADAEPGNASGLLLHEALHAFGKQALGKDWAPLMAELAKLAELDAPAPRGDTIAASQFGRQIGVPKNENNMFETALALVDKDELATIKTDKALTANDKIAQVYTLAVKAILIGADKKSESWAHSINESMLSAADWNTDIDIDPFDGARNTVYSVNSTRAAFVAAYVMHKSLGDYKNSDAEPRAISVTAVADALTLLNEQPGLSIVNAYNQAVNAGFHKYVVHTDSAGGVWRKHDRLNRNTNDELAFSDRVMSVQANSANGWCIKQNGHANAYLERGDIWQYNNRYGAPSVAIRFEGDKIGEMQGPQNDRSLTDAQQRVVIELLKTGKLDSLEVSEYIDNEREEYAQDGNVSSFVILREVLNSDPELKAAKEKRAIEKLKESFKYVVYEIESLSIDDVNMSPRGKLNIISGFFERLDALRAVSPEYGDLAALRDRTAFEAQMKTIDTAQSLQWAQMELRNKYSDAIRDMRRENEKYGQNRDLEAIKAAELNVKDALAAVEWGRKILKDFVSAAGGVEGFVPSLYKSLNDKLDARAVEIVEALKKSPLTADLITDAINLREKGNENYDGQYEDDYVPFSVKSDTTAGNWISQGRDRVFAAGVKPGMQAEEFAAYAIENYETAPASIKKWVDGFLAKLKVAIAKLLRKMNVAAELRVAMLKDPAVLREIALQGLKAAGARAQRTSAVDAQIVNAPTVEASSSDVWLPVGGLDNAAATAAVRDAVGSDVFDVLNAAGLLNVVSAKEAQTLSGDANNSYQAFATSKEGRIYIINDRVVNSREINGLVMHEAIHGLVQHLIGKTEFERVMTHLANKAMSSKTTGANWKFGQLFHISQLVQNEQIMKAGKAFVYGQRVDEIAAYGVQSFAKLPPSIRKSIRLLIGKLRVALHRMLNKLNIAPAIRAELLDSDAALYALAAQSIEHAANLTLNGKDVAEMAAANPLNLSRFGVLNTVAAKNAVTTVFEASVAPKVAAGVARAAAWVAGKATSSGPAAAGSRAANRVPGGAKPFTDKEAFRDFINVALSAVQRKALYDYAHSGTAAEMFRKLEVFNTIGPGRTRTDYSEMLDPDTGVDNSIYYLYQAYLNGLLQAYEQTHKNLTGATKDVRAFEDKAKEFMGVYTGNDVAEKMLKDLTTGVTKGYAKRGMPYQPERSLQKNLKSLGKLKNKLEESTVSIRQAVRDILFNDWDRLYDSGVPALVELGNMIQVRSGLRLDTTKDMPDRGYLPAVEHIRSWWLKKLGDKYDHLSPESRQKVLKELYRQEAAPRENKLNEAETEAFKNIRAVYRKAAQYAVTHGILEKDQVRDNYMAVIFNVGGNLAQNRYVLVKLLSQMNGDKYKYEGMLEKISEIAAKRSSGAKFFSEMDVNQRVKFIDDVANRAFFDANDVLIDNQLGSQFKAANKRIFQDIFDNGDQRDIDQLVSILEPSLEQHGVRYFEPLVAKAEWARRGGDKRVAMLLDKARAQGASEKVITAAKRMADAAQLKYDFPFIDGVRKGSPTIALFNESLAMKMHNRKVLTAMQNIGAYQNLRLLPLALLSSLVDPQGMMIRNGGNAGETFSAIKTGLKGLWDKDTKAALIAAAQDVGYFADLHAAQTLHSGFGVGNETPLARTINSAVFKYNGLEAWTRQTRLMAIQAGHAFLVRIQNDARGPAGKKKDDALRYLEELGLRVDDVYASEVQAGPLQGRPYAMIMTPQQFEVATKEERFRNARVKAALVQFADEAMLRPNNMQTPTYFKDPYVRLITQYKAFSYAIYEQITRRFALELSHGNYKVLTAALTYLPIVAFAELIREFLQWGPDGNPNRAEWGPQEYTTQWVQKTGLLGPQAELFGSMYGDAKRNNVPGSSALGPTVNQADQVIDAARGQRDWGTTAHKALPLAALHGNWGNDAAPKRRTLGEEKRESYVK